MRVNHGKKRNPRERCNNGRRPVREEFHIHQPCLHNMLSFSKLDEHECIGPQAIWIPSSHWAVSKCSTSHNLSVSIRTHCPARTKTKRTFVSNSDNGRLLDTHISPIPSIVNGTLTVLLGCLIESQRSPESKVTDRGLDVWYTTEEMNSRECSVASDTQVWELDHGILRGYKTRKREKTQGNNPISHGESNRKSSGGS